MSAAVIRRMGRWSRLAVAFAISAVPLALGIGLLINSRSSAIAQVAPAASAPAATTPLATIPNQPCDLDTVGLRGIREMGVNALVVGVVDEAFPQQEVAQAVAARFENGGVRITSSTNIEVPQFVLTIEAHPERQTGLVMFGVSVRVLDRLQLKRSPDILALVTTYERQTNGIASRDALVDGITSYTNELLERFEKDYSTEHRVATPEN